MTQPAYQHPYTRASITQAEITTIPVFNGDPNTLPIFIEACNNLIKTYGDRTNPNNSLNTYLVRIIKSRLAGEPLSLIGPRKLKTWADIKALLELSFFDQRSEDCLLNDLMVQDIGKNENPYSFGQRIKDMLNLLLTKMQLDIREELIPLKTSMYKNTALQTYKRGLMHRGRMGELIYLY
ncbi:hypothetical protein QE152_g40718 [Popillia japonica]|uniref:Uncharacterized protein n=1 Tax=Popillia japonica TaxID=7064 RepID=A0AAW1HFH4_POPJA